MAFKFEKFSIMLVKTLETSLCTYLVYIGSIGGRLMVKVNAGVSSMYFLGNK